MKNTFRIMALILALITLVTVTAACGKKNKDKDGESSQTEETGPITKEIIVYSNGMPNTYTVTVGETPSISVPAKSGCYFVGAFDSLEGGNKYFDEMGKATAPWDKNAPTTLYAQFKSVTEMTFSQVLRDEDPVLWRQGGTWLTFQMNDQMKNAISANLDATLNIKISFAAMQARGWDLESAYATNLKEGGEKVHIVSTAAQLSGNTYTTFEKEFQFKAKLIKDGQIHLYVAGEAINMVFGNNDYSVKNATINVSFASASSAETTAQTTAAAQ